MVLDVLKVARKVVQELDIHSGSQPGCHGAPGGVRVPDAQGTGWTSQPPWSWLAGWGVVRAERQLVHFQVVVPISIFVELGCCSAFPSCSFLVNLGEPRGIAQTMPVGSACGSFPTIVKHRSDWTGRPFALSQETPTFINDGKEDDYCESL